MVRKVIIACVVLLLSVWAHAQTSSERSALSNIEKKKWARAYEQLTKAIHKDSSNAPARYVMAQFFFASENPDFQIDSAYHYVSGAVQDFQRSSPKERDRMKRFLLDSLTLIRYRERIDSAAFQRARQINTELAYESFLDRFSFAAQRGQAITLRHEAAYANVLSENTYEAFLNFLQKYPQAEHAAEAKAKYEQLLFEAKTQDKCLISYKNFLKEYPESPYRKAAERNIFEISTAAGITKSFEAFIKEYPTSSLVRRAQGILYHLLAEESHENSIPPFLQTDSLLQTMRLVKGYLVPFLKTGRFGFMDQDGNEVIHAQAEEIGGEYRCGNITEEVIVLPDKILSRNGAVIFNGAVTSLDDLGYGYLKVETTGCVQVIHKSGFVLHEGCVQDARLLNGKLVALKKDDQWSVWTLTGRILQPYAWDDITFIKDVILYRKDGKFTLATIDAVAAIADQEKLKHQDVFDEVKRWTDDHVWVRAGMYQGVLDQALAIHIKVDHHMLVQTFFGCTSQSSAGFSLFNKQGEETAYFAKVESSEPWVKVQTQGTTWRLFDPVTKHYQSPSYDSISITGPFAIGLTKDSARVHFGGDNVMQVPQPVRLEFVPGQDSSSFLLLGQQDKKMLYNRQGKKLFIVGYDKIQHAGQGLFIVHKKEKKGLVDGAGKLILPVVYDAIGSINMGMVSVLKAMKFGVYDSKSRKLIMPEYDKNLMPYNHNVMTGFKNGFCGFIGWDNKLFSKFEFDEVKYWNDTTALVRKKAIWMFYSITSKSVVLDMIKDYKLIRDTPEEKLAIIRQENNYGVISSKKGIIIPLKFSDLINVGSPEEPTYFTERHVEEASIFVVIYYNKDGELIRREVYEQDEYERVYCQG